MEWIKFNEANVNHRIVLRKENTMEGYIRTILRI